MPPSKVSVNFLGGEELPKISSKSVRRTQPELHTSMLVQSTIAIGYQLYINVDAPGTPPRLVQVNFLGGEELPKICTKSVRRTHPELHTSLLVLYTIAMAAIVNQLNMNVDAPGRVFER